MFSQEFLSFNKVRLIGITTPVVDFIPDSEGIISYCARVSNPSNQDNFETADKLLAYCVRQNHWSVFDMVNLVVEVETPRDIARQMLRHSSMKFQEFSQRTEIANEWYERQKLLIARIEQEYKWAIRNGIAKECARVVLPEGNTMSYLYANMTVRQFITYLGVRDDEGVTQKEHVDIARKLREAVIGKLPSIKELI
jgi:thymidylate synthase (FAD)